MSEDFTEQSKLSPLPHLDHALSLKIESFTTQMLDQITSELLKAKGADATRITAYGVRLVEAVLPRRSYVRHEHTNTPSQSHPIPESGGAP